MFGKLIGSIIAAPIKIASGIVRIPESLITGDDGFANDVDDVADDVENACREMVDGE